MSKYKYNPNAIQEKIKEEKSNVTSGKNVARTLLGQGLAFGFGDEIEASIRSMFSEKDYNEIVKEVRGEIDQFRDVNPALAYGTEIAGAVLPAIFTGGASLAGQAAARGGAKLATSGITNNMAKLGQFAAKNPIKTSMAQGAAYGMGTTQSDPNAGLLKSIGDRAFGGVEGAAIGGTLGAGVRAITPVISQSARKLMNKDVDLTTGQMLDGNMVGRGLRQLEENMPLGMMSGPIEKSYKTFNVAALNELAEKTGVKISKDMSSPVAFEKLVSGVKNQIDDSVSKLSIKNPTELYRFFQSVLKQSDDIDEVQRKALMTKFAKILIGKSGNKTVTGKDLQQLDRLFRKQIPSLRTSPDSTKTFLADALEIAEEGFRTRLSGKELNKYLQSKDAYRKLIALSRANTSSNAATFTPAQLGRAARQGDKSAGKINSSTGKVDFADLTEAGQQVLTRTAPNSGTVSNAIAAGGLLGGLFSPTVMSAVGPALLGAGLYSGMQRSPLAARVLGEGINAASRGIRAATPNISGSSSGMFTPDNQPLPRSALRNLYSLFR